MRCRFLSSAFVLLSVALGVVQLPEARAEEKPFEVRVVVVTTFEAGKDTGDKAGELQNWVEKYPCNEPVSFPLGVHQLYLNRADHVLCLTTGMGKTRTAASVVALGSDPRFDLTKAYWMMAGIAGVDPHAAPIGSAVWARYVVDGDLAYEIDGRELPAEWPTGILPNNRSLPYAMPVPDYRAKDGGGYHSPMSYRLNPALVEWAYDLTRKIALPDNERMKAARTLYKGLPEAQKPPYVLEGDTLSADRFWLGSKMTAWAGKWLSYWTEGQGRFVTTAEEDSALLQAVTLLAQDRRADLDRVLVLRTASNFSMPPEGTSAAEFIAIENSGHYSAFDQAVDNAYRVGEPVVRELAGHWERYGTHLPTAK